ncbi:MAG: hypothetical protein A3B12_00510 [Candidatus Yanofskybacteria bacterium RIFCSPLOWO2_01_FULL_44_88]|nr:MAG: hypothetical protein A3B12_00510 [Candidatus Yanofskybacteria bacterium RIFCSPLOWO2_01_FULL_44_88]
MSRKSKKILVFASNYLPHIGGAELALNEIVKRNSEFRFDIITTKLNRTLPDFENKGNIRIYRVGRAAALSNFLLPKSLFPAAAFIKALLLTIKTGRYDIVFSLQASQGGGAAWLYKLFFPGTPFLLNIQEGKNLSEQGRRINFFRNLILKKADVIIAISNYLKAYAQKINPKADLFVIPNGVDLKKFKIQSSSPKADPPLREKLKVDEHKTIITVSRLVEKNGLVDLVEAIKYLDDSIGLIVIGQGPLEKTLKLRVKNLNLENRIEFVGEVANERLPDYLAAADIFVRPSLSEGLGIAFIEAMAMGVPVIGTPVGGILDLIKNQETGLLCEVGNPKDIAAKIQTILNDDILKQRLIANAKQHVANNYDWDLIASRFRELFYKYGSI